MINLNQLRAFYYVAKYQRYSKPEMVDLFGNDGCNYLKEFATPDSGHWKTKLWVQNYIFKPHNYTISQRFGITHSVQGYQPAIELFGPSFLMQKSYNRNDLFFNSGGSGLQYRKKNH